VFCKTCHAPFHPRKEDVAKGMAREISRDRVPRIT
jgi:hypothetical protein